MAIIPGLQSKGVFALHCEVDEDSIAIGRLWVRDADKLGQIISLVESDGEERYAVRIPSELPFPADNVRLERVAIQ